MVEEEVQQVMQVDKQEVEEEEETRVREISQQSPPTPQKQDTKVNHTPLTCLSHLCNNSYTAVVSLRLC